jgi:hypothetical protein
MRITEAGLDAIIAVTEVDASVRFYQLMAADIPREPTIVALLQAIARCGWLIAEMPELTE